MVPTGWCHCTHSECFQELFEANDSWTAYLFKGDVNWPARSPDLAPCDFFLWGYLKAKVYINRPNTLEDIINNIEAEIDRIPVDMLVRVNENFRKRQRQIHYLKPCNLKIPLLSNIIKK